MGLSGRHHVDPLYEMSVAKAAVMEGGGPHIWCQQWVHPMDWFECSLLRSV